MSDEIEDNLVRIRKRLLAYYAPAEVDVWLHAKHPRLSGSTAFDLIEAGLHSYVDRIIDQLDCDVYL